MTPGFIDLHSHGQTPENYRYKAMDGVTTALELEVGVSPVSGWYTAREGKALIHYGASAGHIPARMAVMPDLVQHTMARASMVWVTSCTAAMMASGVVFSGVPRWDSMME